VANLFFPNVPVFSPRFYYFNFKSKTLNQLFNYTFEIGLLKLVSQYVCGFFCVFVLFCFHGFCLGLVCLRQSLVM
jgi:hypothetical protein